MVFASNIKLEINSIQLIRFLYLGFFLFLLSKKLRDNLSVFVIFLKFIAAVFKLLMHGFFTLKFFFCLSCIRNCFVKVKINEDC